MGSLKFTVKSPLPHQACTLHGSAPFLAWGFSGSTFLVRGLSLLAITAFALAVFALSGGANSAQAKPVPVGVELIVQSPLTHKRPANHCVDRGCQALLEVIDSAQHSLDFAFYGIRNQQTIFDALLRAKMRGVKIRGIVDMDAKGVTYYQDSVPLMKALGTVRSDAEYEKARGPRGEYRKPKEEKCPRPPGFQGPLQCLAYDIGDACIFQSAASREAIFDEGVIMHHKFAVADGLRLWTGSMNVSDSGTGGYDADMVLRLNSRLVAGWYVDELEQMYEQGRFQRSKRSTGFKSTRLADGSELSVYFAPQDKPMERGLRPLLQGAQRSIDVAIFYLTHAGITQDLIQAHRRGVKVRIIVDATSATNGYSKHEILRAAGIPVKVENWGGKMHMKAAAVDGQFVVGGSMNWTRFGESENDENTLILKSPKHAAQWTKAFERMWTSIPERWLQGRPAPESWESINSCTDGVDNNFNDLADDKDPGCSKNPPPPPPLPPLQVVSKRSGDRRLVKGVVNPNGRRFAVDSTAKDYRRHSMDFAAGARYFCSMKDAEAEGWQPRWKKTRAQ